MCFVVGDGSESAGVSLTVVQFRVFIPFALLTFDASLLLSLACKNAQYRHFPCTWRNANSRTVALDCPPFDIKSWIKTRPFSLGGRFFVRIFPLQAFGLEFFSTQAFPTNYELRKKNLLQVTTHLHDNCSVLSTFGRLIPRFSTWIFKNDECHHERFK